MTYFCDIVRIPKGDDEKYKRDQLCNEKNRLNIDFACYEWIFTELTKYRISQEQAIWYDFTANEGVLRQSRYRF